MDRPLWNVRHERHLPEGQSGRHVPAREPLDSETLGWAAVVRSHDLVDLAVGEQGVIDREVAARR